MLIESLKKGAPEFHGKTEGLWQGNMIRGIVGSSVRQTHANSSNYDDYVLKVIYESISDLNVQLPQQQWIEKSPHAVLFGADGKLDSLGLANFIVIAEQKFYDSFGFRIDLTENDPFSLNSGYFRTIESLANYVSGLVSRKTKVHRSSE